MWILTLACQQIKIMTRIQFVSLVSGDIIADGSSHTPQSLHVNQHGLRTHITPQHTSLSILL
jgi:hypothetical protein